MRRRVGPTRSVGLSLHAILVLSYPGGKLTTNSLAAQRTKGSGRGDLPAREWSTNLIMA